MQGIVIVALLGAVIAGCDELSNECSKGEQRCHEHAIFSCQERCEGGECRNRWHRYACDAGQVCVEAADGYALCAVSTVPDPGCRHNVVYCRDDETIVTCSSGYATSLLDCGATGRACVDEVSWDCVESETRRSDCNGSPENYGGVVCEGDFLIECMGGYVTRSHACAGRCVKRPELSNAECELPDSATLCVERPNEQEFTPHCAGDSLYYCSEGVAYEIQDCSLDGQACVERDPAATGEGSGCEPLASSE